MATENALMAAALTRGTTVIRNAASEPHVQDLAHLLIAMGADRRHRHQHHGGPRRPTLGRLQIEIAPDHIEIGSFMALAAVTRAQLRIVRTGPERSAHRSGW